MAEGLARGTVSGAPGQQPRRRWLGAWQVLVIAVLVLAAFAYSLAPNDAEDDTPIGPPAARGASAAPPPLVSVVSPTARSTRLRVSATGSVAVRNYVELTPQVGGRVVSLSPDLRSGGAFRPGEALLTVDRRDYELALESARAEVAVATATLALRTAEGDAARANYALLNPGDEVPPLVAKAPQIAQGEAQLAAAKARAEIAALDLERTSFALPFAGRIIASSAEVGQVLGRGQPFGRAYAEDALEVVVPLLADDVQRLAPVVGRKASVRSDAGSFAAVVERVSAELDERSRFATLYLTFEESGLQPGTFVDVQIEGPELASTFLLPAAAEQVRSSVWLVAGGVLESFTPVSLGRLEEGWIVSAFDTQDGIVLGAVPGARDGLAVAVGSR